MKNSSTKYVLALENNILIFQLLKISLNLTKSGNVLEKMLPVKIKFN